MKYGCLQVETYQALHILLFLMKVRKEFDNFVYMGITKRWKRLLEVV